MRRISLRKKLALIVGLTFAYLIITVSVDSYMATRVADQLGGLEQDYVPMLRYGPRIESSFENLRRNMQDAVAAQDRDLLERSEDQQQAIVRLLSDAPAAVDRRNLAALQDAFEDWSNRAYQLSGKLIDDQGGEDMLAEIRQMQAAQKRTWDLLQKTVYLDEAALAEAFADARRAYRTASTTSMALRAALFVTVALMMILIGRRILRSFAELNHGFGRFGRGDFSRPVAIDGGDELGQLAAGANEMAREISELQQGLEDKQRALEQANQELESFSYSVSHDLRAPLRGIDGFSQALIEDYHDELDDTGKDYLRRVRAAAQRMGQLIDDLLSLSRIGRSEVHRDTLDLSALAKSVADELQGGEPGRQVDWAIEEGLEIDADRGLMRIALENLLGNAWKFTGKQPAARIELGAQRKQSETVYFVRDNGAGFDSTYQDKLFGAFQRLHHQKEFEGTGIGLATVKRVVHKHGGHIWADSTLGAGATFYFTLGGGDSDDGQHDTSG